MPIKTLNNQSSQFLGRAFPTLLKLSKGEMQGNRPVDLDYFKPRDFLNDAVKGAFESLYGEKPVQFANVGLLGNTLDTIAPNWLEEWGKSSGLVKRCDGETMQVWRDKEGAMQSEPMPCACAIAGKVTCKPTMYLSLILPDLINASGYLGIVRLTLHSTRELSHILTVLQAQPSVIGLPVERCRWFVGRHAEETTVMIEDKQTHEKKPSKVTKYFVKLSVDMENTLAGNPLLDAGEVRQLPATTPTVVDPQTGEIIADEMPARDIQDMIDTFHQILYSEMNIALDTVSMDADTLEEFMLDSVIEDNNAILGDRVQVIQKGNKKFYNILLFEDQKKKIIAMREDGKPVEIPPSYEVGTIVYISEGTYCHLEKTSEGNYKAFPHIAS